MQWCRLRRCSAVAVEHVHRLVEYPGQPPRHRGLRFGELGSGVKAVCHVRETVQKYRAAALLQLFDVLADVPEASRILRLEQVYRQVAGACDRQVLGFFPTLRRSHEQPRADRQQATQRAADARHRLPVAHATQREGDAAPLGCEKYLFAAACDGVVEQGADRCRVDVVQAVSPDRQEPGGVQVGQPDLHAALGQDLGQRGTAWCAAEFSGQPEDQPIARCLIDLYRNLVAAGVDDKVLRALSAGACEQ